MRLQDCKFTSPQILLSCCLVDLLSFYVSLCDFANFARKNILVIREIRGEIPDSSSELLSFFNARIREFVGECGIAVKDAIYQELGKKL